MNYGMTKSTSNCMSSLKWCVVIADGIVDIVEPDGSELKAHVKDLKEMGCTVKVKRFSSPIEADAYAWKVENA